MGQNAKRSNSFSADDDFEDELNDQLQHPQQRNAANARERARMRVLSKAFCRLKTTLPWVPPDTKLSKLDTLRLATSYIAHLRTMLKLSENEIPKHSVQRANMSWPFNFNVNWDQGSRTDQETPSRTDWSTYDSKVTHTNNVEKSYDYQHERRNPNHRTPRNRRKAFANEEMDYAIMDSTHEFDYYKPYSYYEPT